VTGSFHHPFAPTTGDHIIQREGRLARATQIDARVGAGLQSIADQSVTFCPPLVTTDEQVDQIIDAVAGAVSE
jgi:adenosylmethionine-8-amino-7-oxononanoate aminotransferase